MRNCDSQPKKLVIGCKTHYSSQEKYFSWFKLLFSLKYASLRKGFNFGLPTGYNLIISFIM